MASPKLTLNHLQFTQELRRVSGSGTGTKANGSMGPCPECQREHLDDALWHAVCFYTASWSTVITH